MGHGPRTVLRAAFVGGPMYDPLYDVLPSFEAQAGVRVEIVAQLPHPELNAFVRRAFDNGDALDLISTHTKYAPSQTPWLRALDDLISDEQQADLLPRPTELSRIDGRLFQVPRNLDVRLLHYRRDLLPAAPQTWTELFEVTSAIAHERSNGAPPL